MEFNKNGFSSFRKDIEEAIKEVAEKHQVKITTGNISYTEFDFTMGIKVVKQDGDIDVNREKFKKECKWYGFTSEQYKVRFVMQGKEFELVGFNPKSPKNNCSITSIVSGDIYKCNDSAVKRALGMKI